MKYFHYLIKTVKTFTSSIKYHCSSSLTYIILASLRTKIYLAVQPTPSSYGNNKSKTYISLVTISRLHYYYYC